MDYYTPRSRRERRISGTLPPKSHSEPSSRYTARHQHRKASKVTFSTALFSLGIMTAGMGTVAAAVYSSDSDEINVKRPEDHLEAEKQLKDIIISPKAAKQDQFADISVGFAEAKKKPEESEILKEGQEPAAPQLLDSSVSNPDIVAHSKEFAKRQLQQVGFSLSEFQCLDVLYTRESNWRHTATNPSSGAYGIVQALPAGKMSSVALDWRTNPETQIIWGLDYIKSRYGTPCGAMAFWNAHHWY